jgi:two-component system KDP operon response regulator KdpE
LSRPGPRALIADEDRATRRLLRVSLKAAGYSVFEAATTAAAVAGASAVRPDVIVLNIARSDGSGIAAIRRLREFVRRPILVLSPNGDEAAKIAALDAGADDYLTTPFGVGELLARLRVMLRHVAGIEAGVPFQTGDLTADLTRRDVTVGGRAIRLTATEYEILKALIMAPGRVLTHRQLLRQVWGYGYEAAAHLLRVNISNLRRKLEPDPRRPAYVLTEMGVGYRLRVKVHTTVL